MTTCSSSILRPACGNAFNLGDGGWLVVGNGLDASASGFNFLAGGTLETMGTLSGMDSIEGGSSVFLAGTNAIWDLGTNALYVGSGTSSNQLGLSGGARLISADAMVGAEENGIGNKVVVDGDGSLWTNAGDLALGGSGSGNALHVTDGGAVDVGKTLSVRNHSTIVFASGGHASAFNYHQDATSVFSFDSISNIAGEAVLSVGNEAEFEAGATMRYAGSVSDFDLGVFYTNLLVSSDSLVVGGVTNAVGADLDVLESAGEGSLLTMEFFSENDDLYALIARMRLSDSAGFGKGSMMAAVSDEIDQLASAGDPLANTQLNTLMAMGSSAQNAELSQLYDRHAPTYSHMEGMLGGFRQTRQRGIMPDRMWPVGAYGPHFHGSQVEGWVKGYGSWTEYDGSASYSSYDQSVHGMVAGIDKAYGNLLAGLAGGYAVSDIDQGDGDSSKADTGYGLFYASWGTTAWFGDAALGYGRSSIEDRSGTLFDTSAEYDADQFAFYIGGGKEMVFRNDQWFLTPSAALLGSCFIQESYTEKSTTAVPRDVDSFDYFSLQSEIGLKVDYMREYDGFVLVPEVHANWRHEFNDDEQEVDYSLVGGTGGYSFGMDAPLEDLFEVGVGLSLWAGGGSGRTYEWVLGYDGRFGDGYSESAVSARLLCEF